MNLVVGQASCLPASGRLEACPATRLWFTVQSAKFLFEKFSPPIEAERKFAFLPSPIRVNL